MLFLLFLRGADSLLCYDSSFPAPHSTQECGDDMVCYQEYYAIRRSTDRVDQYFERFCVSARECRLRGFHGVCTQFQDFDHVVKDSFEKFRLRTKHANRTHLAHSKFCCCDTPLCNSFDAQQAEAEFQLYPEPQKGGSLQTHVCLSLIIGLLFIAISL